MITKPNPSQGADAPRESATAANRVQIQERAHVFPRMPKPLYDSRSDPEFHPQRAVTRRGIAARTTYRQ